MYRTVSGNSRNDRSTIKGLKDNPSPCADGIYPKLLKEIVDEIGVPRAIVFNLSIQEGSYKWSGKMKILYLSSKMAVDVGLRVVV